VLVIGPNSKFFMAVRSCSSVGAKIERSGLTPCLTAPRSAREENGRSVSWRRQDHSAANQRRAKLSSSAIALPSGQTMATEHKNRAEASLLVAFPRVMMKQIVPSEDALATAISPTLLLPGSHIPTTTGPLSLHKTKSPGDGISRSSLDRRGVVDWARRTAK
jgi:hypothetical protein